MLQVLDSERNKILILISATFLISFFHYVIPTDTHLAHMIHIVLRKFYFLPLVLGSAWFGLKGGIYQLLVISILFSFHAFLDWPDNYMEQANQAGELVTFWAVGLVSGALFDRERAFLREISRANEETVYSLVSALDLRDKHTRYHSQRVRDYALLIAEQLGIRENIERTVGIGALLHDVGKIAVPDHILLKPGSLSRTEWEIMRSHPEAGFNLVRKVGFLKDAADIVYSHHEHFDGSGYPRGLREEEIHVGARIFAVADMYDALTTERPYRKPVGHKEALALIEEGSGTHFDPSIVRAFLRMDIQKIENIKSRYSEDLPSDVTPP